MIVSFSLKIRCRIHFSSVSHSIFKYALANRIILSIYFNYCVAFNELYITLHWCRLRKELRLTFGFITCSLQFPFLLLFFSLFFSFFPSLVSFSYIFLFTFWIYWFLLFPYSRTISLLRVETIVYVSWTPWAQSECVNHIPGKH